MPVQLSLVGTSNIYFKMLKLIVVLLAVLAVSCSAKKGVLELDEITWDRVVDGSKNVLVAFTEYSWKDPENYDKVSEEFKDTNVLGKLLKGVSSDPS